MLSALYKVIFIVIVYAVQIRIARVTDTTIQLDWYRYVELEGMAYYRVVWSSTAQPMVSNDTLSFTCTVILRHSKSAYYIYYQAYRYFAYF